MHFVSERAACLLCSDWMIISDRVIELLLRRRNKKSPVCAELLDARFDSINCFLMVWHQREELRQAIRFERVMLLQTDLGILSDLLKL